MISGHTLKKIIAECLTVSGAEKITTRIYSFGSSQYSSNPNDIDILLIVKLSTPIDFKLAIQFRKVCSLILKDKFNRSTDVIILTEKEEVQSKFASFESATLIWSCNSE